MWAHRVRPIVSECTAGSVLVGLSGDREPADFAIRSGPKPNQWDKSGRENKPNQERQASSQTCPGLSVRKRSAEMPLSLSAAASAATGASIASSVSWNVP